MSVDVEIFAQHTDADAARRVVRLAVERYVALQNETASTPLTEPPALERAREDTERLLVEVRAIEAEWRQRVRERLTNR